MGRSLFWVIALAGCGFDGAPLSPPGDARPGLDATDARQPDAPVPDGPPGGVASPRRLVFDNPGMTLDNVPVLVELTPSRVEYAQVPDPQTGLRFQEPGGGDLPYDVESWNPGGISYVWVRVPRIDGMSTTDSILMHFGAGIGGANRTGVWAGYRAVHHLGPVLTNAASNDHDAIPNGATPAPGIIAGAAGFAANDHSLSFENANLLLDEWPVFSLEYWIRLDYATVNVAGEPRVVAKSSAVSNGRIVPRPGPPADLLHQIDWHFGGNNDAFLGPVLAPQTWTYVAWCYDGERLRVYADGVEVAMRDNDQPRALRDDDAPLVFGHASNAFRGQLDEIRISQVNRTPAWIALQNRSMRGQLVTFVDP